MRLWTSARISVPSDPRWPWPQTSDEVFSLVLFFVCINILAVLYTTSFRSVDTGRWGRSCWCHGCKNNDPQRVKVRCSLSTHHVYAPKLWAWICKCFLSFDSVSPSDCGLKARYIKEEWSAYTLRLLIQLLPLHFGIVGAEYLTGGFPAGGGSPWREI